MAVFAPRFFYPFHRCETGKSGYRVKISSQPSQNGFPVRGTSLQAYKPLSKKYITASLRSGSPSRTGANMRTDAHGFDIALT